MDTGDKPTRAKYFIQEHLHKTVFHGGIGNVDIERILLAEGFIPVVFPYHFDFSLKAKCFRYLYLMKVLLSLPSGTILFFQFPLYARMHSILLRLLTFRRSMKLICLVGDINGLKDGDASLLQKEIAALKRLRYFIVHGDPMENWLKNKVPSAVTASLNFFDFLAAPATQRRNKDGAICFAGNLAKSPFLEQLHQLNGRYILHFHVYGPDASEAMKQQSAVTFKGVVNPYELPGKIDGSYGLLWDGESIRGAGGSLGDYMQYISHHKLSLYILAGVPLIVYDKAGSAGIVKRLEIGITVGSLYEIGERLASITEEEYQQMRKHMEPIARRIASGSHLKDAIAALIGQM